MKKTHFIKTLCAFLFVTTAGGSVPGFGKLIVYPGAQLKPGYFASYYNYCLFPEGSSSGNKVHVNAGSTILPGPVAGNDSALGGDITDNTVIISGRQIHGEVFGGYGYADDFHPIMVTANIVAILGGEMEKEVYGGFSNDGVAADNTVMMSGGKVIGMLFGGYSYYGVAAGNTVIMAGGEVKRWLAGGGAYYNVTMNNTVIISGGQIQGDIYGGHSTTSAATGNTVTISGGRIQGSVYGGYSDGFPYGNGDATVTGNTVILKGNSIQFDEYSAIYGGYTRDNTLDAVTGNTLILDNFSGAVGNFCNFEKVALSLTSLPPSGSDAPVLILHGNETTLKGTSLSISIGNCGNVAPGQSFILIRANDDVDLNANGLVLEHSSISAGGIVMRYELLFTVDGNLVNATVAGVSFNPQTTSLSEGRIVPLIMVNRAADLVASLGVNNAVLSAMSKDFSSRPETFFAMAGGHSSYDTGSHVDLSGFSAMAGVSSSMPQNRSVVLGAFVETGYGNYSTHNTFENVPSVRGSGSSSYCGAGMLARWDMSDAGLRGVSLEASFRAGSIEEDYSSGDLTDGLGNRAQYDFSSPYYGGHAGIAFTRSLGRSVSMSSYARFLWNRVGEEDAVISGDEIRFHALTSHRLQGGARFHYEATKQILPYAGMGYEWECSGSSRAMAHGNNIAAPSLRGGTGTMEAGVVFQVAREKPVFVDVGVKGYIGKREGVSGNVQLRMAF